MVLSLTLPCRVCGGNGWHRLSDPAGRGEAVVCEACQPKPIMPEPKFDRFLLWHIGGARSAFTLWHYDAGALALAEVAAKGFFDKAHDLLRPGDRIMVSASDGACDLHVTAATEAGGVVVTALRSTGALA